VTLALAVLVLGVLGAWVGATMVLDAWSNRRAAELVERLPRYQSTSVADEAERWLRSR
jgi:hypothetical protein